MKEAVVLKSYQGGIAILLDGDAPFELILEEITAKFTQARAFFGKARVAVSLEGRKLSQAEEIQILTAIRSCSDLEVLCIVGKDEYTQKIFLKALKQTEKKLKGDDEGQFFKGSLKNHEMLETETSIIVLGDVSPGCAVVSTKNIIILGGLYGEAYAGGDGSFNHYIVALEMNPETVKIGDFKYHHAHKQKKWGFSPRVVPKIAYVRNRRIVFEPLTKDLLSSFHP